MPKHKAKQVDMIELMVRELVPATGCTEPAAVAYAAAVARNALNAPVQKITVRLSGNVVKNGMSVNIPGTRKVGLEVAAAMGALGGDSAAGLDILNRMATGDIQKAEQLAESGNVTVAVKDTPKRLYIEVTCAGGGGQAMAVIEDSHTNITRITANGKEVFHGEQAAVAAEEALPISLRDIWAFATAVPVEQLRFLRETADINMRIAREGLAGDYGLTVGKTMLEQSAGGVREGLDEAFRQATAMAAAAIDARLSGCEFSVVSVCGSGSHGIAATVPVIAVAECLRLPEEKQLRALAVSLLVTIHVKSQLGRLSPICGCGMAASIGASSGITLLLGGDFDAMCRAVNNMVADVSGIICDGGKPACALKIATAVNSACRNARLALNGVSASPTDGIVARDAEESIRNLSALGNSGMKSTDALILSILMNKCS